MAKAGCDIGGENAPNTRENCPKRYFGDGFETLKGPPELSKTIQMQESLTESECQ